MTHIYELINCEDAEGHVTEVWDVITYGPYYAASSCTWMIPGTYEEYA
jgi:hypothetical protein